MTALILRREGFLRRIDPNDDPHAEPLSVPALLTVLVLTGVSPYFFLRLKIQPMHRPASRVTIREWGALWGAKTIVSLLK